MLANEKSKIVQMLALLTLSLSWLYSFLVWPYLPEQIPAHFGFSGRPTRWQDTTMFTWLLLPTIGLFIHAFMYAIRGLISKFPESINFTKASHYKAFRKMTPAEREPIIDVIINGLFIYMIPFNLIWLLPQIGSFYVATGVLEKLPGVTLPIILILSLGPLIFIPKYNRELEQLFANQNDLAKNKGGCNV